MSGEGRPAEIFGLPRPPPSWDAGVAKIEALEKHVLSDLHGSEEAAYNAALGAVISSYLESLPPKDYIAVVLTLKGPEGFPEARMLEGAGERGRDATLTAARELRDAGKLRRVRNPDGEIFWIPAGPLVAPHDA